MSGGYPKALVLSQPVTGAGVVFASDSEALLSWSAEDGGPLGELRGKVGSDPQIVRMSAYEGTLYFCADLPADSGTPGKYLLHAMDIATRTVLWTHRTNRPFPLSPNGKATMLSLRLPESTTTTPTSSPRWPAKPSLFPDLFVQRGGLQ
jgi:hypothetical protein